MRLLMYLLICFLRRKQTVSTYIITRLSLGETTKRLCNRCSAYRSKRRKL